ncbi:MAG: phage holin family protein [Thermoanaerobacteraceae bacterium]|uniref:Phage holin family protein n=1 Tax=Desulfofundulus thermobenzoicus TaxID=29376 RepID=A0A6N7IQ85_9FIRM|nr:phage holin family protein [Desulfofundulus thermobenzoicus]MBE3587177.1 phage holin family protein [Thermoanaerobacteraceae bacterium]MQL51753.1 phage holin family protein [Desulfofundulus thermobenzoicus]HHW44932.1 phage holin family protein [Desulfotomaculum sp.]
MRWLLSLCLNGLALLFIDHLVPGFRIVGIGPAVLAAFVLGIVNTLVRPVLVFFTLPLTVITLGLFIFVINAITFTITAWLVPGFQVYSFAGAFWGALLTSMAGWLINLFLERE